MSLLVTCTEFFTRLPRLPCSTKERVALEERQAQLADAADARGQRERQERPGSQLQRQQEQAVQEQPEGQDAQGLGQLQHKDNLAEEPQLAAVQQAAGQQQRCAEQAEATGNSALPAAALPEQQRFDSQHPARRNSGHGRPRLRQPGQN